MIELVRIKKDSLCHLNSKIVKLFYLCVWPSMTKTIYTNLVSNLM